MAEDLIKKASETTQPKEENKKEKWGGEKVGLEGQRFFVSSKDDMYIATRDLLIYTLARLPQLRNYTQDAKNKAVFLVETSKLNSRPNKAILDQHERVKGDLVWYIPKDKNGKVVGEPIKLLRITTTTKLQNGEDVPEYPTVAVRSGGYGSEDPKGLAVGTNAYYVMVSDGVAPLYDYILKNPTKFNSEWIAQAQRKTAPKESIASKFTGLDDIRNTMNNYGSDGMITDMGIDALDLNNSENLDESIKSSFSGNNKIDYSSYLGTGKVVARETAPKIIYTDKGWRREGSYEKGEVKESKGAKMIEFYCPKRQKYFKKNLILFTDGTASMPPKWDKFSGADGYNAYSEGDNSNFTNVSLLDGLTENTSLLDFTGVNDANVMVKFKNNSDIYVVNDSYSTVAFKNIVNTDLTKINYPKDSTLKLLSFIDENGKTKIYRFTKGNTGVSYYLAGRNNKIAFVKKYDTDLIVLGKPISISSTNMINANLITPLTITGKFFAKSRGFDGNYSNLTNQSLLDGLTENTSMLQFDGDNSNYLGLGRVVNLKQVPLYSNSGSYYVASGSAPTKTIKNVSSVSTVKVLLSNKTFGKVKVLIFDDGTAGMPTDWEFYSNADGDDYSNGIGDWVKNLFRPKSKGLDYAKQQIDSDRAKKEAEYLLAKAKKEKEQAESQDFKLYNLLKDSNVYRLKDGFFGDRGMVERTENVMRNGTGINAVLVNMLINTPNNMILKMPFLKVKDKENVYIPFTAVTPSYFYSANGSDFHGGYSHYEGMGKVVNTKEVPLYRNTGNYYIASGTAPTKTIKNVSKVVTARVVLNDRSIVKRRFLIFDDGTVGMTADWDFYSSADGDYSNGIGDWFKNLFSKKDKKEKTATEEIADPETNIVKAETMEKAYEESGKSKPFGEWLKSDTGKTILNVLAQVATNVLAGGQKGTAQTPDGGVKVTSDGGVVITNPNLPITDDKDKDKDKGKILGMSPVTFGIVAVAVIGLSAFAIVKLRNK